MTANPTALRRALVCNAVFSSLCGASMSMAPAGILAWLGIEATPLSQLLLQALGLGLLIFAADLAHQATRPRLLTWRALYASTADLLWVVTSMALIVLAPSLFSASGVRVLSVVALVVVCMAFWQLWAIDRTHRSNSGRHRHCIAVSTPAPASAIWAVIADLGEIQRYMPSLKQSTLLDGAVPGRGAVRHCEDHSGKRWREACTVFEPPCRLGLRFLADEPDFPYPAHAMDGGWEVKPQGSGSVVQVWWELEPKPRWLAPVLLPLLGWQADRDFPKVIARMTDAAMGQGELDRGVNGGGAARASLPRRPSYPC